MLEILRLDQQPGIGLRLVSASLAMSLLCLAACQIAPEHPPPHRQVLFLHAQRSRKRRFAIKFFPTCRTFDSWFFGPVPLPSLATITLFRRKTSGVKSACLRTFANRVSLSRSPSGIFTLTQRKHGWTKAQNSSPNRMTRRSRALPGTCSAKECWMPPNTRRSKLLRLP